MSDKMITVTQIKSGAHAKPKTRGTLRALGLGRIGKTQHACPTVPRSAA